MVMGVARVPVFSFILDALFCERMVALVVIFAEFRFVPNCTCFSSEESRVIDARISSL